MKTKKEISVLELAKMVSKDTGLSLEDAVTAVVSAMTGIRDLAEDSGKKQVDLWRYEV